MVNNIKETINKLSAFKPGISDDKKYENEGELASTIQALIQDVWVELKYSAKLLPEVCYTADNCKRGYGSCSAHVVWMDRVLDIEACAGREGGRTRECPQTAARRSERSKLSVWP